MAMNKLGKLIERLLPDALTNRVFVLYSVTLLAFVGTGLGLFLRYQYQQQVEDTQQASIMLVEVVAQALQDSVVIGDYDTVRKTLDKAVLGPTFATAVFLDTSGGKVSAQSREEVHHYAPDWLVKLVDRDLYDVNRSISVGGKDYGVLRLQFDAPHVAADLWSVTSVALSLGLLSLVGGLVLIRFPLCRRKMPPRRNPARRRKFANSANSPCKSGPASSPWWISRGRRFSRWDAW